MTTARVKRIVGRIVPPDQVELKVFPRELQPAQLELPFAIVRKATVSVADVARHIGSLTGQPFRFGTDRLLRGCLVCFKGSALLYLARSTPEEERFTLAHELVHLVAHYLEPRELAVETLGPGILDVLDGNRRPSAEERVAGILSGCPVGIYRHIMPAETGYSDARREDEADDIALEALAPLGEASRKVGTTPGDPDKAINALQKAFGIPLWAAKRRATEASRVTRPGHHGFLASLKKAVRRPSQRGRGR